MPLVPRRLVHAYIKRLLVTWQHPEDSLFSEGEILINRTGRRFCDECDWPAREIAVSKQPDKIGFILLDQRYSDAQKIAQRYVSALYWREISVVLAFNDDKLTGSAEQASA